MNLFLNLWFCFNTKAITFVSRQYFFWILTKQKVYKKLHHFKIVKTKIVLKM